MRGRLVFFVPLLGLLVLIVVRMWPVIVPHSARLPLPNEKLEIERIAGRLDADDERHFRFFMEKVASTPMGMQIYGHQGVRTVGDAIRFSRIAEGEQP